MNSKQQKLRAAREGGRKPGEPVTALTRHLNHSDYDIISVLILVFDFGARWVENEV